MSNRQFNKALQAMRDHLANCTKDKAPTPPITKDREVVVMEPTSEPSDLDAQYWTLVKLPTN